MGDTIINEDVIRQMVIDALKKSGITVNIPIDKIQKHVEETLKPFVDVLKVEQDKLLQSVKNVASATQEVKITKHDGSISTEKGLFHADFSTVFNLTIARNPVSKFPVGLWLWGEPGAGKTHLAEQIANALDISFYPIYGGPTMTETKLLGYKNAGAGIYVKGLTYDWYVNGGLLAIDEADLGESLACMNSLFANQVYRFPDGNLVKRNENTYFMALANTDGMGAKSGFRRSVQDAAALDRFNFWKLGRDDNLEKALAGEFGLFCEYVQNVRKWVQGQAKETNLHVTPRATMRGVALLATTEMSGEDVANAAIFGRFPPDTKSACIKACGIFQRDKIQAKIEDGQPKTKRAKITPSASDDATYKLLKMMAEKAKANNPKAGLDAEEWLQKEKAEKYKL